MYKIFTSLPKFDYGHILKTAEFRIENKQNHNFTCCFVSGNKID